MDYRVVITDEAEADLEAYIQYLLFENYVSQIFYVISHRR